MVTKYFKQFEHLTFILPMPNRAISSVKKIKKRKKKKRTTRQSGNFTHSVCNKRVIWRLRNTGCKELRVFHGESLKDFPKPLNHISGEQQNPEWWLEALNIGEENNFGKHCTLFMG